MKLARGIVCCRARGSESPSWACAAGGSRYTRDMKDRIAGAAALLVLLGLQPAFPLQGNSDERKLEEAAELLGKSDEAEVRRGANLAARVGSPAAVELILDVFDETARTRRLPPGHYRDIVWDSLVELEDHYGRMRIEQELAKNKRNADLRLWCAELLGIYGEYEFGATLTKALSDKDLRVRQAAARSLGMLGYAEADKALQKLARNRDPYVRADALIALVKIDADEHRDRFLTALAKDKDGGVRCALLYEVPQLWPEETEALSIEKLEDDDWRPRIQAVQNLASVKTKGSVDHLVGTTADARPVVSEAACLALSSLTGQKHTKQAAWQAWWQAKRETFDFPAGLANSRPDEDRSIATYHGIQIVSDHVAFLIDKSSVMAKESTSMGISKDAAAYDELANVLSSLDGDLNFNVFTYERRVEAFEDEPVALKKKTCKQALEFVDSRPCQDRIDIWQVLELVVSDPSLDTVYLLSSGEPDIGLYVHWNRVTRHLKNLNRFHKVVVHSIAFTDNEGYQQQLEKIAEATGGEFRVVE
jgi:HEAT repeat protein